jgi:hypothetical protein
VSLTLRKGKTMIEEKKSPTKLTATQKNWVNYLSKLHHSDAGIIVTAHGNLERLNKDYSKKACMEGLVQIRVLEKGVEKVNMYV